MSQPETIFLLLAKTENIVYPTTKSNTFLGGKVMKKVAVACIIASIVGCSPDREVVEVYKGDKGDPGTSCSVVPEVSEEDVVVGARISCTDGSFSIVLNGEKGDQGVQGPKGDQGVQGPVGQTGPAGASCQAYKSFLFDGVWLACPNQLPVFIADGEDGKDGKDGKSCSVSQQNNGAKITCGNSVAFVYNGTNGTNGTSCTVSNVSGGAKITCGNTSQIIYDGEDGAVGPVGPQGPQGEPGENALANAIGIKGYIYPCGQEFNNDEIFLRLTDGKILALYDGGPHLDRLVLLAPGNYVTTDRNGASCNINVSNNLTVTTSPAPATGLTQGGN